MSYLDQAWPQKCCQKISDSCIDLAWRLILHIFNKQCNFTDKRLGTDLVTLSIKHSAIVVEPFLIQPEREYYLAIDGYRWQSCNNYARESVTDTAAQEHNTCHLIFCKSPVNKWKGGETKFLFVSFTIIYVSFQKFK